MYNYKGYFLIILGFILIAGSKRVLSQVVVTSSDSLICGTTCTTLTASVTIHSPGTPVLIGQDDIYSVTCTIPFTFKFYGNNFGTLVIGANGHVKFSGSAGSYDDWNISGPLSTITGLNNNICGPFCDINPAIAGSINYSETGTAPYRRFAVTYCDMAMFNCSAQRTTSQIILYETTNVIEVHVGRKPVCIGWNSGRAIIGIRGASGAVTVAPGRDATAYTCFNEGWRFTPIGTGSTYSVIPIPYSSIPATFSTVYWYNVNTGVYLGSGSSINVCPSTTTTYKAGVLSGCADTSYGYYTVTPMASGTLSPITGNMSLCVGTTSPLSEAVTSGTWSSGQPLIATINVTTGVVTGVHAGSVIVTYDAGGGCKDTALITVASMPSAIYGNTVICIGASTALSNMVDGGTWSSSNTGVATVTVTTGIATGVSPGTVTITYSNSCGSVFRTFSVSPVSYVAAGNEAVCAGSTITLSNAIRPGVWSSGNTMVAVVPVDTGQVTGLVAGTSVITYMTAWCTAYTTTVAVNFAPIVDPAMSYLCTGTTTALSYSPAGGTWSSGSTSIATVSGGIVGGIGVGTTTIIYGMPGCSRTVTVTVKPQPSVIGGDMLLCVGDSTYFSNGVTGGVWTSMSPGVVNIHPVTGLVKAVSIGVAIIDYSTGTGCLVTATVTVGPLPLTITGNRIICVGLATMLSDAVAGGTWSSGSPAIATVSATGAVSSIIPGNTIITYTMPSGCYITTTVSVKSPPGNITGGTHVCTNYKLNLSDAVGGGTWSSSQPSVAEVNAQTGTVTGVGAGVTVISYVTAEGGGCLAVITVTVTATAGAGNITGPTHVCRYETIALSNSVSGGVWSCGSPAIATITASGIVTGVSAGAFTVTYTVTDSCGISAVTRALVTDPQPYAGIIKGKDTVCIGATIALSDAIAGGTWLSSPANNASVNAGGVVQGLSGGTANILYCVSNSCGADTATHPVRILQGPPVGAVTGLSHVCPGAVFTLSDTTQGGTWSSEPDEIATISNSGVVMSALTGTAVIYYTAGPNAAGCYSVATFTVTVSNEGAFAINSSVTQPQCYGDSTGSIAITIVNGMPPYRYLWSTADTATSIADLNTGVYVVTVTELTTHCLEADTFNIIAPDPIAIITAVKGDVCDGGKGDIRTEVTGGVTPYSYLWSNNETGKEIMNLHAGVYTVSVTDMNSCRQSAVTELTDTCNELLIHNAITPNGDGVNDVWIIEGLPAYAGNTVQVFDKWGDLVFEKTGYNNNWNGSGKGGTLPDGTYYYLIKLNAPNIKGGPDTFTGTLLIKR